MAKVTTELDIELAKWKAKSEEVKRDIVAMKSAASRGPGIGERIMGALPVLAPAAAAAGIKAILDQFDELNDVAARLGETPEVIQRTGRAAELSGASVEALDNAFLKLEKNLGDIENAKAADVLDKYGLSAEKIMALPLDEKILALAEAYGKAREAGTGVFELQELLGRGSSELIPLLEEGGDSIREMYAGTSVVANEAVAQMAMLNDQVDNVIKNLSQLGGQALVKGYDMVALIGAQLAEIFGDEGAVNKVNDMLLKRDEEAANKATGTASRRTDRARNLQIQIDAKREADEAKKASDEKTKADKAEEDRQKKIAALQRDIENQRIDMLPTRERIEELKKQLEAIVITFDDDQLAELEKQKEQLRIQREIDQAQQQIDREDQKQTTVKSARAPGVATQAINALFGRSSNDLILDETKVQTREMQTMNRNLVAIKDALKKDTLFIDTFTR